MMTDEERSLLVDAHNLLSVVRDGRIPAEGTIKIWMRRTEEVLYPSLAALDELLEREGLPENH